MAPFEELQELWQQQRMEWRMGTSDAASVAQDLRRYRRRHDLINLTKMAMLVAQYVFLVTKLRHHPVAMFGGSLADFGAVYFGIHEWRNQRAIARMNFAARSVDFVRTAIARLEAQRNPFRGREFWVMMGAFLVGCNLMLSPHNWLGRALVIVVPLAMYYPSVYLRAKRWDWQTRPLVERLKALAAAAEEEDRA